MAWLIDSLCIGLVAAPLWGSPIYSLVVSGTWLFKDLLLNPFGLNSPGYHLLGLEKVHLPTLLKLSNTSTAVNSNEILSSEALSLLGHNTLRFFTNMGLLGSLSSGLLVGHAFFFGVKETCTCIT
jgi:hypothetical protein